MSTRATIVINNKEGKRAIAIYQHSDGYIHQGLGSTLFCFLKERELVNGYGQSDMIQSNGLGDLAAQLVTHLKEDPTRPGGTYIMIEGEEIHGDVEYVYYITPVSINEVHCPKCGYNINQQTAWEIKIVKDGAPIFTGSPEQAIKHFGHNPDKPLF